jgi:uncharacterized protein (TIGR03435 family)
VKIPLVLALGLLFTVGPAALSLIKADQGAKPTEEVSTKLPEFEVATIKPTDPHGVHMAGAHLYPGGRVVISATPLLGLVAIAFRLSFWQISGGDAWVQKDTYDVQAKPPGSQQASFTNLRYSWYGIGDERLREMLQALLIERFQLRFHRETKTGTVFLLERNGKPLKLRPTDASESNGYSGNVGFAAGRWVRQRARWTYSSSTVPRGLRKTSRRGVQSGLWQEDRKMRRRVEGNRYLSLRRKLALGASSLILVAGACVLGLLHPWLVCGQSTSASETPSLSFDVVSIRPFRTYSGMAGCKFMPGRFSCKNAAVKWVIVRAYNVMGPLISGGPNWASSDPYDIEAKESDELSAALEKLPRDQRLEKQMLLVQSMLADRFHLKVHRETKELPVYALVVAKNGPKLKAANIQSTALIVMGTDGRPRATSCSIQGTSEGGNRYQGCTVATLADFLPLAVGRVVLDQTGLKGIYDFTLNYSDQNSAEVSSGPAGSGTASNGPPPPVESGPSVFTAVQEQLGLKLEPTKGPVDTIIIDHIERPSEN